MPFKIENVSLSIMENRKSATVMLIGDTGAGKSTFGNLFLKESAFKSSEEAETCTLHPVAHTSSVNGIERTVIDTAGFCDTGKVSDDQIHELGTMLRRYSAGINAVCLVLNGTMPRFSQNVKNLLTFMYNFCGKPLLSHLCIVFTNCDKDKPDRDIKKRSFKKCVDQCLSSASGEDDIPHIPMYFVDSTQPSADWVIEEMTSLYGWVVCKNMMNTEKFVDTSFGETREEVVELGVKIDEFKEGNRIFDRLVDRKCMKVTPNDGRDPTYTEWVNIKEYSVPSREERVEKGHEVTDAHPVYKNGNKYKRILIQERKVIYDLKENRVIEEGQYTTVGERLQLIGTSRTDVDIEPKKEIVPDRWGYTTITWSEKVIKTIDPDGRVSNIERKIVEGSRREDYTRTKKKGGLIRKIGRTFGL